MSGGAATDVLTAIYHPAEIRKRTRVALSVGGMLISGLLVVLGVALMMNAPGMSALSLLLGMWAVPLALHGFFAWKPRPAARAIRIECHPGHARLSNGIKLSPRDIVGASTTLHDGRYLLHLYVEGASMPHAFEFETEEQVVKFRKALGLKHDGTGFLEWPMAKGSELWLGLVAGLGGMLCSLSSVFLMLWTFLSYRALRGNLIVAMRPDGLFIPAIAGNLGTHIRYADIASIEMLGSGTGLLLKTTSGHTMRIPSGHLSRDEWRRVAAQLDAASRRARGERTERERPLERVVQIQRGEGETFGSWLARLEAASMHSDYRGGGFDPTELLRVAEDMDEGPLNRLAAARLLRRMQKGGREPMEDERVRIDEVLANMAMPERLVRVALESDGLAAADAFADVNAEVMRRRVR